MLSDWLVRVGAVGHRRFRDMQCIDLLHVCGYTMLTILRYISLTIFTAQKSRIESGLGSTQVVLSH
jgi:hypothetical protein